MSVSELEKIVKTGKAWMKAFEGAEEAIKQIRALEQTKADLTNNIAELKAEAEKVDKATARGKKIIADAEEKAASILSEAKDKGETLMKSLSDKASKAELAHENKMAAASAELEAKLGEVEQAQVLLDETKAHQVNLDKAIAATKKKLQGVIGD